MGTIGSTTANNNRDLDPLASYSITVRVLSRHCHTLLCNQQDHRLNLGANRRYLLSAGMQQALNTMLTTTARCVQMVYPSTYYPFCSFPLNLNPLSFIFLQMLDSKRAKVSSSPAPSVLKRGASLEVRTYNSSQANIILTQCPRIFMDARIDCVARGRADPHQCPASHSRRIGRVQVYRSNKAEQEHCQLRAYAGCLTMLRQWIVEKMAPTRESHI